MNITEKLNDILVSLFNNVLKIEEDVVELIQAQSFYYGNPYACGYRSGKAKHDQVAASENQRSTLRLR